MTIVSSLGNLWICLSGRDFKVCPVCVCREGSLSVCPFGFVFVPLGGGLLGLSVPLGRSPMCLSFWDPGCLSWRKRERIHISVLLVGGHSLPLVWGSVLPVPFPQGVRMFVICCSP
jgi:hypothetical protein